MERTLQSQMLLDMLNNVRANQDIYCVFQHHSTVSFTSDKLILIILCVIYVLDRYIVMNFLFSSPLSF